MVSRSVRVVAITPRYAGPRSHRGRGDVPAAGTSTSPRTGGHLVSGGVSVTSTQASESAEPAGASGPAGGAAPAAGAASPSWVSPAPGSLPQRAPSAHDGVDA